MVEYGLMDGNIFYFTINHIIKVRNVIKSASAPSSPLFGSFAVVV